MLESHENQAGSILWLLSLVLLHVTEMLVALLMMSICKCRGVLVPVVVSAEPIAATSRPLTIQDGRLDAFMHPKVLWPAGEAGITGDSFTGASRETGMRVPDCAVHRTLASTLAGSPARLHSRFRVVFPTPTNVVLISNSVSSLQDVARRPTVAAECCHRTAKFD